MGMRLDLITGNTMVFGEITSTDWLHSSQNVGLSYICTSAAAWSPSHRNWWRFIVCYLILDPSNALSFFFCLWKKDIRNRTWQIWHFDSRMSHSCLIEDSLDPPVQSRDRGKEKRGVRRGCKQDGNSLPFYSKFDMYRKSGCIHFLIYHVKVFWKKTKKTKTKNKTIAQSASISFYTLKHIMVQHGWRQCQNGIQIHW